MAISLFLLMDSIGNIPIFLSILKELNPKRQRFIIFRELMIALFVIIGFYFLGNLLLGFLHISQQAVLVSGGIILFIIALKLIFSSKSQSNNGYSSEEDKEPFIVPLAIPLVAGPAVLAATMLYARQDISILTCIAAIVIAWIASTIILLSAVFLKRLLGDKGILACERLTGLILIMLAVQMFLDGISPIFRMQ